MCRLCHCNVQYKVCYRHEEQALLAAFMSHADREFRLKLVQVSRWQILVVAHFLCTCRHVTQGHMHSQYINRVLLFLYHLCTRCHAGDLIFFLPSKCAQGLTLGAIAVCFWSLDRTVESNTPSRALSVEGHLLMCLDFQIRIDTGYCLPQLATKRSFAGSFWYRNHQCSRTFKQNWNMWTAEFEPLSCLCNSRQFLRVVITY